MAICRKEYHAKGGSKSLVADSETLAYSAKISNMVLSYLGVTKHKTGPMLLYRGDQFNCESLTKHNTIKKILL